MSVNLYKTLKKKHQDELDKFPLSFALTKEQLKYGMNQLGLKETDTDKIVFLKSGAFIRKIDVPKWEDMILRHNKEIKEKIANDKTGDGFIKDMFIYEMNNYEYSYTNEIEPVLEALKLTLEEINNTPNLSRGLTLAKEEFLSKDEDLEIC